jgi:hypothetical protein
MGTVYNPVDKYLGVFVGIELRGFLAPNSDSAGVGFPHQYARDFEHLSGKQRNLHPYCYY